VQYNSFENRKAQIKD